MNVLTLPLLPLLAAGIALVIPNTHYWLRRAILPAVGAGHLALVVSVYSRSASVPDGLSQWLGLDAAGLLFLGITSILFFAIAFYALFDLARHASAAAAHRLERFFIACLLFSLFTMALVCMGRDMGVIWAAVAATTLAVWLLLHFRRCQLPSETARKYFAVCSVGLVFALAGTILLAAAGGAANSGITLHIAELTSFAPHGDSAWLKAAFIFLLVGYGTAMGLAPMHTWLPDAVSELPSPVAALASGAVLNTAFLAMVRAAGIVQGAGLGEFVGELWRLFGLFSLGLAGVFMAGQKDCKRLLAYSSVGFIGLLAFASGLGGTGLWVAFFLAVTHALVKSSLLLTAGNIHFRYRSTSLLSVRGLRNAMPINGGIWLAGILALCGLPPFGVFLGEFAALKCAFQQSRSFDAILCLVFLAVVFISMVKFALAMLRGGDPLPVDDEHHPNESIWLAVPPALLLLLALFPGVAVPGFLGKIVTEAVRNIDPAFVAMPGVLP